MADEKEIEATFEDEDEEATDDAEFMSAQEEFGALMRSVAEEQRRLKRVAMGAQQAGDNGSANVLREVAGTVLGICGDIIAACGAWFEAVQEHEEDGSHLEEEDAEKLYALLGHFKVMVAAAREQTLAGTEQRDGLDKLDALIDDQRDFLLEVSDYEPEDTGASAPPEKEAPKALGEA